jgi:prefoldin alpha subunit
MDQKMLLQAVELEKQVRDLEQHSTFINQQLTELKDFHKNLESFSKAKAEKMLASLGKGVYVQSTPTEGDLFVEVGAGVIVKKNPEELKKVIEEQITGLQSTRMQVSQNLQASSENLQIIMAQLEQQNSKEQGQ